MTLGATAETAGVGGMEAALWRAARVSGILLTGVLLWGLWWHPEPSVRVLWYAVIPVLPAVFLVHPGLWRNVCPLATLNTMPGRWSLGRRLDPRLGRRAMVAGMVLLAVLVPARRFLFNADGPALAVVIAAVAVLALALGFVFDRKAGFCNALCPVLSVERLYGQKPLVGVRNAHCASCSACTIRGCLDLAPRRSAAQVLPDRNAGARWLLSPFGAFAAAFPGFVLAYNLLGDVPLAAAGPIYGWIAAGAGASWLVIAAGTLVTGAPSRVAVPAAGILALTIYYWFAASSVVAEWGLATSWIGVLRAAALLLVAAWLAAAWRPALAPARPGLPG